MLTSYAPSTALNGYALGLRLPEKTVPILKLHWRQDRIPSSPPTADRLQGWGFEMGGNNRFGTCGPTSVSNHRDMTLHFLTGGELNAPLADIFALYRHSGSPHFDPNTGRGDNGVTMQELCSACEEYGFAGTKVLGYAQLADADDLSVQACIDRFGGVLMAVNLQTSQSNQTDRGVWDYSKSPDWGGHAILAGAYDREANTVDVVTWQKRVKTTGAFRKFQAESYWVIIWPELVTSGKLFDSGVDVQQLADDYRELTGRVFPAPIPPAPRPVPPPVPPGPPGPAVEAQVCIYPETREYRVPAGWRPRA